jgi:hypothetical protein
VEVGPTLTHDDLARVDLLATEALHSETLGIAVASVARARGTLLMRNDCSYLPVLIPVTRTAVSS